jgi:NAD(P)-dependent dehydrogenase (short-subunit alcohol dehydrogenase family)
MASTARTANCFSRHIAAAKFRSKLRFTSHNVIAGLVPAKRLVAGAREPHLQGAIFISRIRRCVTARDNASYEAIAMQVDLSGLRALVTGSTKGIGRAIAETLAANGAEVVINGRKSPDVEAAIKDIRSKQPKARLAGATGDVADAEGVANIIKASGAIDILVNNAGVFEIKDAFEIPDEEWQRLFATNVMSGVRLTRHYGPLMRAKGFGRIVFISSESGVQIPTEMIHYGVTKAADLAVMRGFAQALAATGVTVNAVLPGPTLTEGVYTMFESMGKSADDPKAQREYIDGSRPSSIIKRLAKPQEVANAVAFLCSREASAITGSPMRVDGGVVMSIT